MISLTVSAVDGKANHYGLTAEELQENIHIDSEAKKISGKLKYVKNFLGFSSNAIEQNGNYLALSFASEDAEKIETRVIGGTGKGYANATDDKFCIYRITNEKTQKIEIRVTKEDKSKSYVYDLSDLILDKDMT